MKFYILKLWISLLSASQNLIIFNFDQRKILKPAEVSNMKTGILAQVKFKEFLKEDTGLVKSLTVFLLSENCSC